VKSEVDEKNLDEEIAKIKDRLSARHTEQAKKALSSAPSTRANDDDFFNSPPPERRPDNTRRTATKRPAQEISEDEDNDDDDDEPAVPSKKRVRSTTAAKPGSRTAKVTAVPVRKPPARTTTSAPKNVFPSRSVHKLTRQKTVTVDSDEDDNDSVIELSDEDDDFQSPPPRANTYVFLPCAIDDV
jgi:hypothetical protein